MAGPFDLDLNEVQAYITNAANSRGIDPQTALRVWQSEGQGGYTGDAGTSFGPFQLHYGQGGKGFMQAGMGNDFTSATGLHASDPSTWKQQVDFALDKAKTGGWGPWYGAKKAGITGMQGIGGQPQMQPMTVGSAATTPFDNAQPPPPLTGKQNMPWYPENPQGLFGMGMNPTPPQGLLAPQPAPQPQPQPQPQPSLLGTQQQQAGAGGNPNAFQGWGSGSNIWPMLMALGAGIAGGNGWGEGIGQGLRGAAASLHQSREDKIREALYQRQVAGDEAEAAHRKVTEDQGAERNRISKMNAESYAKKLEGGSSTAGYMKNPDGTYTYIKGGPADPEVIGKQSLARGRGEGVPQAVRTDAIKADQAYTNLEKALTDYETTVKEKGNVWLPGKDKDLVNQQRRNVQLQLKELFNLGVLNGPDLSLMDQMLFDPNASVNPLSGNFGASFDVAGRVTQSVTSLKEMLRGIRNSKTQTIGLPDVKAPVAPPEGYEILP